MTAVKKRYDLQGKYAKLFDAKRGKFHTARVSALQELDQTMPTFTTWQYFAGPKWLEITFATAPTYLVEDDFFDCLEKHYDLAVGK